MNETGMIIFVLVKERRETKFPPLSFLSSSFFFLSSSSPPENYYAVPYCFPVSFISLRYIVIKIQWRSTFEIKSKEERGKKEGKKKEGKTPISMRIVMNYNFPHTERWLFRDRF